MYPLQPTLGKAHLGARTFVASAHPSESCGSNGLPLTPNSIRIYGRARALYLINHPHLCTYVDIHRGKHERILVVQEHYLLNLKNGCEQYETLKCEASLTKISYQILQGLFYLNNFGTICHTLSPENVLITPDNQVKLSNYGLYYMTEAGSAVSFPIGVPKYLPPEVLIGSFNNQDTNTGGICGSPAWDVWSLGIIILEVILGQDVFPKQGGCDSLFGYIFKLAQSKNVIDYIAQVHNLTEKVTGISQVLRNFLDQCLELDPSVRPTPGMLLNHSVFQSLSHTASCYPVPPQFPVIDPILCLVDFSEYKKKLKITEDAYRDVLPNYPYAINNEENDRENKKKVWRFVDSDHLGSFTMREVYHLWQLAGGSVDAELKRNKLIHTKPSILTLPSIMVIEGEIFGSGFQQDRLLQTPTCVLNLSALKKRLAHVPCHKYYPLITQGENGTDGLDMDKLPLVIREKDVEYQFHRLLIFNRLLKAYPYKLDCIIKEARKDVPPYYRPLIWAALLRVDGAVTESYEEVDKETPTSTDRQIEVDIPRCHQYDELLSSPRGHFKFARVLKAWVVANPHLVYWQGLDSLCAPFLALNFNNEALAYACLTAFINKYLGKFFLRDNSAVIQEYLAKFSHMIAFHEPKLFNHLHSIGFVPDLYAIPWFLTMYTHVFPLHKIYLLWDTLLLGGSSLPLCIGVALLRQLRDRLLCFGFNECILLFSDMPDIKMEQVVEESKDVFCTTPPSITFRQHDGVDTGEADSPSENTDHGPEKLLMMQGLSIQELRAEICARISGADVIELLARRRSKSGHGKIVVIDVRPADQYARGTITSAVNIPAEALLSVNSKTTDDSELHTKLKQYYGRIIAIMGSRTNHEQVVKFAETLVQLGFPRVCILHRGVDAFRGSGHLIVPT